MGTTDINNLFCKSNMPVMNNQLFKTHEKEVGAVVEAMAKESCKKAILEEKKLTIEKVDLMKRFL